MYYDFQTKFFLIVLALLVMVGGIVVICMICPFFIPFFVFLAVMLVLDAILKKLWNIPQTSISSLLWIVISAFEAIAVFFGSMIGAYYADTTFNIIFWSIDIPVYLLLSFLSLRRRYRKLSEQHSLKSTKQKNKTKRTNTIKKANLQTIDENYIEHNQKEKEICVKLKKNSIIDTAFWEMCGFEFKYNLVSSSIGIALYFEMINNNGFSVDDEYGGITIKVNFYDKNNDIIYVDDMYVDNDNLIKQRFSDYLLLDYEDVAEAESVYIYAYFE